MDIEELKAQAFDLWRRHQALTQELNARIKEIEAFENEHAAAVGRENSNSQNRMRRVIPTPEG